MRSLLVPGWGQVFVRRRGTGWALVASSVLLAAATAGTIVYLGPLEVAARLADPTVLLALLTANIVVALARLLSTGHAWWAGGGRNLLVGSVLAILVLIPHAAVAWVGVETRETLLEVFASPEPISPGEPATPAGSPAPATTTTTTSTSSTTSTSTTTTTTVPRPRPLEPPRHGDLTPPTVPVTVPPFAGERLNFLLLGGDAGPRRSGLRTDTIMVVSIDADTGQTAVFGIPRNYGGITFSDGSRFGGRIINEVYQWGRRHPDAFGGVDPGAAATRDVVEHLTGLQIDYFVLVDLTGFADVVDAFGGVTLDVPRPIEGPLYDTATGGYEMVEIPAGRQTLDGDHALAYSRARHGSTDYARMGRQRCVLWAMARDVDPLGLLSRLPALLEVFETHVTTDIPTDQVPDLIRLTGRLSTNDLLVVGFDHTTRTGRTSYGAAIPDIDAIRTVVNQTLADPGAAPREVAAAPDACA